MAETSVLTTLKELINDDVFIEKGKELARLFYSNSFLTIDLYVYLAWGTAIAAVLLLMFLLFGDESKLGGITSGYGTALSKSYETEDAIIELQQQVFYVPEPSGKCSFIIIIPITFCSSMKAKIECHQGVKNYVEVNQMNAFVW